MNKPAVSVILPTYNRAHLIRRAICSVLNQTYQNIELVIVDDGSTDNTEDVVKSFGNERIRYIRNKRNKGAGVARNTGIGIAENEYIAFQDSDDEWFPEKLEKQMKIFDSVGPKVGVVYTGFWRIKHNRKRYVPPKEIVQRDGVLSKALGVRAVYENFVSMSTSVVRKDCFRKAGDFDEQLPRFQDWELWIRISKHYDFRCVDEPLVNAYESLDSISRRSTAALFALKHILHKHFEDIARDKRLLGRYYFEIGTLLALNGKANRGKDYLRKAVTRYPFNIKSLLSAFLLFSSPTLYNKATTLYLKLVEH